MTLPTPSSGQWFLVAVVAILLCVEFGNVTVHHKLTEIQTSHAKIKGVTVVDVVQTPQQQQTTQAKHDNTALQPKASAQPCVGTPATQYTFMYPYVCFDGQIFVVAQFSGKISEELFDMAYAAVSISAVGDFENRITLDSVYKAQFMIWSSMSFALVGTIPTTIARLGALLQHLYWDDNELEGTIPTQIGLLTSLTSIEIERNRLSTTIPTQFGLLTRLAQLGLGANDLLGTLPSQLGILTKLTSMAIDISPQLTGTIPTQFARLTALANIELTGCSLEGTIPWRETPGLTWFSTFGNNLHGEVPWTVFNSSRLISLRLGRNQFTGTIPTTLGETTRLIKIELQSNQFSGTIPSELGQLVSLETLNISSNSFSGLVPSQLGLLTMLTLLDLSHNDFHGSLPAEIEALLVQGAIPTFSCLHSGLTSPRCLAPRNDPLSKSLFAIVSVISLVGLLALTGLMGIVWKYRNHTRLRTSGPLFSFATLFGLALLLCFVPLVGVGYLDVSSTLRTHACRGALATLSFGLVVVLSCIGVRNYPIYRIFNNPHMKRIVLTPRYLMRAVVGATLVNTAFVVPLILSVDMTDTDETCSIGSHVVVRILNVVYVGLLFVFAVGISIVIRNAPCEYNETTHVARATYNVATFGLAMIVIVLVAKSNTARFLGLALCVFVCVLSFVLFVHASKVITVVKERISVARSSNKQVSTVAAHAI